MTCFPLAAAAKAGAHRAVAWLGWMSAGWVLCCGLALAQPAAPLMIGMTVPLSGPDSAYGRGLAHGVMLAAGRANDGGGIQGRRVEVVALDDRGDASRAAENARELLRRGAVALTGVHGARAAAAVADVLAAAGTGAAPLVAPATGAESLRSPAQAGVFHLRAGTFDEMNAAMLHLDTVGLTRYALVAQEGAFGASARTSLELQLVRIGLRPVATQRLDRAADARGAMSSVCTAQPQVVVLALSETLALAALEAGRALACSSQYLVFSETGAALAERASSGSQGKLTAGLLVTQVMPHPNHIAHPLVADYQRTLASQGGGEHASAVERASYPSIEGYQAMRLILEVLRSCGREAGRACLIQALSSRSFELAGQRIQFGSEQRLARPYVEVTLLDASGRFRR